jgi:hypothetical protein
VHRNGADWLFNVSGALPGDAGRAGSNNSAGSAELPGGVRPQLAGPDGRDFRPKAGSLFDRQNVGPYHPTDVNGSSYWIPGKQLHTASHPVPGHGGTGAAAVTVARAGAADTMLAWREGFMAVAHSLHLFRAGGCGAAGCGEEARLSRVRLPAGANTAYPFRGAAGRALLLACADGDAPGAAARLAWRVDAEHADGSVATGPMWELAVAGY